MMYVKEIMKMFGCSETLAFKVFDHMGYEGFDFSESSTRAFKTQARKSMDAVIRGEW